MPTLQKPISIIGAGLSGLTLARCLRHRNIPFRLYDKTPSKSILTRHNYGITLYPSTYQPLLSILGVSESAFKSKVAVDRNLGGNGKLGVGEDRFRVNCAALEAFLREGVDITWSKAVKMIVQDGNKTVICMEGGERVESEWTVVADGVHSLVRGTLTEGRDEDGKVEVEVLPFVVYNGKRWVPRKEYEEVYAPAFEEVGNIIEYRLANDTLLSISLNDIEMKNPDENENENASEAGGDSRPSRVSISYTYSRPAFSYGPDPLHRPNRSPEEATHIPPAFYDEISNLHSLPPVFAHTFSPDLVHKDRVLHWLMRSSLLPLSPLKQLATRNVAVMGDAVHAEPILGGEGANVAIADGVGLAEWISERDIEGVEEWYEERWKVWEENVNKSRVRLQGMHGGEVERAVL